MTTPTTGSDAHLRADVVVIGGGLAGLTCAMGLRGSGVKVIVVEQENILGGRARSWTDTTTGDPVPIGPHIFASEYSNMLKLLDLLGTRDRVVWQKRQFITMVEGQHRIRMHMSPLPAPFHFVPSLITDRTLSNRDWLSNVPVTLFALTLSEADLLYLDQYPAIPVLRRCGVSSRYLVRFWAFVAHSILNVPLELCSAGAILRFYRRFIGKRGFQVGFPDRGLGDVFAPQSARLIKAEGGRILLGTHVKALLGTAGRATGVELHDGRRIEAQFCVAALTPQALLTTLRPEWKDKVEGFTALERFQPSSYRSVFLWFDRKLTKAQFWARVYRANDLNCDFYDFANIYRGWAKRPSLIASNIIYADRVAHMSDEEIVDRTLTELAEFLPQASGAQLRHSVVHHIPMAIHCPFVGTEQLRLENRTPIQGLILAGNWLNTGLPASMESACLSGWRAAEQILREQERFRPLALPHQELQPIAALLGRMGQRWRQHLHTTGRDPLMWITAGQRSSSVTDHVADINHVAKR
jgi:15-cis-phytoene desaturase